MSHYLSILVYLSYTAGLAIWFANLIVLEHKWWLTDWRLRIELLQALGLGLHASVRCRSYENACTPILLKCRMGLVAFRSYAFFCCLGHGRVERDDCPLAHGVGHRNFSPGSLRAFQ